MQPEVERTLAYVENIMSTLTYRGVQYEQRNGFIHYLLSKKEVQQRLKKELKRDAENMQASNIIS